MHAVILACHAKLAAAVKDRFDRRRIGLTEMVRAEMADTVLRAVGQVNPTLFILVGSQFDWTALNLCRVLTSDLRTRHVPLIVALEHSDAEDRISALNAGADSVVHPFNLDVVERRACATCRRTNLQQTFRGRELFVNTTGCTIAVADRVVVLTAREAMLLRVLVHNRDRTLSRSQLERRIWGTAKSRTLDVHIARLRKKLGAVRACIETVPRVGYRFVE